ncbi:MAG: hypothetical protein J6C78_07040 [Muribaculaceae bacterium]|nr:hypothetical protein [Muribaculaceae bacterium]
MKHNILKVTCLAIASTALSSCDALWDSSFGIGSDGYNMGINVSTPIYPLLPPSPPSFGGWTPAWGWDYPIYNGPSYRPVTPIRPSPVPPPRPGIRPPLNTGGNNKPVIKPDNGNRPGSSIDRPGNSGQRPGANLRPGRK